MLINTKIQNVGRVRSLRNVHFIFLLDSGKYIRFVQIFTTNFESKMLKYRTKNS